MKFILNQKGKPTLIAPLNVAFPKAATTIVINRNGDASTASKPSRSSFMALWDRRTCALEASSPRSGNRRKAEIINERPSTANAVAPPANATIDAPIAGPVTSVTCLLRFVNEFALGKDSLGTISGTIARYAG